MVNLLEQGKRNSEAPRCEVKNRFNDNLLATSISSVERLNGFRAWIGARIKGQPEVLEALDAHFGPGS